MRPAEFWIALDNHMVSCTLCPHNCLIKEGMRGICKVRKNIKGELFAVNYGLISSLALDPIEKKPLKRFFPGSQILSLGGFGCNFHCPFCQNCRISLEFDTEEGEFIEAIDALNYAKKTVPRGNIGIAYTYNEPLIGYEFIYDCTRLIREEGLKNVVVTNGYINEEPLMKLLPYIDAMNIDLKAFTPEFYQRIGGNLEAVKKTIAIASRHCHLEVTTLVIPEENENDIVRLSEWLSGIDPDIPLHLSRFYPRYKYSDKQAAAPQLVSKLAKIARQHLNYVFV